MKLSNTEQRALQLLKNIKEEYKSEVWLTWVNEYWRVCPAVFKNEYKTRIVVFIKVNMRTWDSLANKGYIDKTKDVPFIEGEKANDDYGYVFR